MQDIGGRPQVILIVLRCAIKVVTYNHNQEEKDAFDMGTVLYPCAYLEIPYSCLRKALSRDSSIE